MVEIMQHTADNLTEKLLRGLALGWALALRGCPEDVATKAHEQYRDAVAGRVRFVEPCRVEHPHSAFLRKPLHKEPQTVMQETLYAPGGKLTEERGAAGEPLEFFVRKPNDFEVLRGFLRDVELFPAKAAPVADSCPVFAHLGLTPIRELETRWAGLQMVSQALVEQNESAASCLRKLERQLHHRCEEATRLGCRVGILRDMAAEPLPPTYMLQAGKHIDWIRHAGISPFVEVSKPYPELLAALFAGGAGVRMELANPALYMETFAPPEGMRFILDVDTQAGLGDLQPGQVQEMLSKCGGAVVLVDCGQANEEEIFRVIETLSEIIKQ